MNWFVSMVIVFVFLIGYWVNYSQEKFQGKVHKRKESLLWGLFFAAPALLVALIIIIDNSR